MTVNLGNYVDVPTRLRLALERWPELRVQESPPVLVTIGDRTFIQITTTVWRTPDDPLPAVAGCWEPFPGRTPYTRDSEMANASTSALGRALGFLGMGINRSIASADEIAARVETDEPGPAPDADKPSNRAHWILITKLRAEQGLEPISGTDLERLTRSEAVRMIADLRGGAE